MLLLLMYYKIKGADTLGNSLIAESKLQFYPTSEWETYRLLGILGSLEIEEYKKRILKDYIGDEKYRELFCLSVNNNYNFNHVLYDYLLKEKDYKTIKNYFKFSMGYNYNNSIVIADLFAGEGRWLDTFYTFMDYNKNIGSKITTIANELDEERFDIIWNNSNIYKKYNKSFEELQLPKNSVSLMLFNPPYGTSNGERNVRRYLQMIIDRQLLYNPNPSIDYKQGYMIFVIRKDDFLDSLDIICRYFNINDKCIYKTHEEEYNKYKQYIFIGRIRRFPYDFDKPIDVADYKQQYDNIKDIIENEPEFNLNMYNNYRWMNYPYIDYSILEKNMVYCEIQNKHMSKKDSKCWKWVEEMTELKDLSHKKINMPKNPKKGEIAALLASGAINGDINAKEGKHVVVGGTKTVLKEEQSVGKDVDGKNVTTTKTIKLSKPYLNILCTQNGKVTIKELGE